MVLRNLSTQGENLWSCTAVVDRTLEVGKRISNTGQRQRCLHYPIVNMVTYQRGIIEDTGLHSLTCNTLHSSLTWLGQMTPSHTGDCLSALRKWWQKYQKFKVILTYVENSRPPWIPKTLCPKSNQINHTNIISNVTLTPATSIVFTELVSNQNLVLAAKV